ncbi:zinc finger protein [Aphelenchoides avenae]|nr:zinc finger protein [Aphelenchus avenae]
MGKGRAICDGKDDSDEEYSPPPDPSTSSPSGASKCAVCGGPCFTKNFGADACRACAAFFRRAVAGRRNYRCKMLTSCGKDNFQDCKCAIEENVFSCEPYLTAQNMTRWAHY